jgi:hypothetical protein
MSQAKQGDLRLGLLTAIVISLAAACGPSGTPLTSLSETLRDNEYGFQLNHPSGLVHRED